MPEVIDIAMIWLYNILAICIPLSLLLAFFQFFAAIVGWRSEFRYVRLRRFGLLVGAAIIIPFLLMVLWRGVLRPSMGSKLLASINRQRAEKLIETSVVQIGDIAPALSLEAVDGEIFSLPATGDVVLINFFASWCGPCQVELPHIEKIWAENKQNPHFKLMVIGREESKNSVLDYRNKYSFTFPIAADPDRAVYSRFATESIPRTLVVSPEGRIVYSNAGFMEGDLAELKTVLRKQLSESKLRAPKN